VIAWWWLLVAFVAGVVLGVWLLLPLIGRLAAAIGVGKGLGW